MRRDPVVGRDCRAPGSGAEREEKTRRLGQAPYQRPAWLAQQQHDHDAPNRQNHVGDGETDGKTEHRHAAIGCILDN